MHLCAIMDVCLFFLLLMDIDKLLVCLGVYDIQELGLTGFIGIFQGGARCQLVL